MNGIDDAIRYYIRLFIYYTYAFLSKPNKVCTICLSTEHNVPVFYSIINKCIETCLQIFA